MPGDGRFFPNVLAASQTLEGLWGLLGLGGSGLAPNVLAASQTLEGLGGLLGLGSSGLAPNVLAASQTLEGLGGLLGLVGGREHPSKLGCDQDFRDRCPRNDHWAAALIVAGLLAVRAHHFEGRTRCLRVNL